MIKKLSLFCIVSFLSLSKEVWAVKSGENAQQFNDLPAALIGQVGECLELGGPGSLLSLVLVSKHWNTAMKSPSVTAFIRRNQLEWIHLNSYFDYKTKVDYQLTGNYFLTFLLFEFSRPSDFINFLEVESAQVNTTGLRFRETFQRPFKICSPFWKFKNLSRLAIGQDTLIKKDFNRVLRFLPSLQSLSIYRTPGQMETSVWNKVQKHMKSVAKALETNKILTNLNLEENGLGAGVKSIAKALEKNQTLKKLSLMDNDIAAREVQAIGEMLKVNQTLETLNLCRNPIGPQGTRRLGEALRVNRALTELNLEDSNLESEGAQILEEGLRFNSTLTWLNLRRNEIRPSLWSAFTEFQTEGLRGMFRAAKIKGFVTDLTRAILRQEGGRFLENLKISHPHLKLLITPQDNGEEEYLYYLDRFDHFY